MGPILDEAVIVCLLDPFINNRAGPVRRHLRPENGGLVTESAWWGSVATSFTKEDWNTVSGNVDRELRVTRCLKRVFSTPFISVECEEVDGLIRIGSTSQVILKHGAKRCNISCRIADRDLAISFGVSICFEVSRGGLDIGTSCASGWRRENLITDEEACNIVEGMEGIHDLFESFELGLVPMRINL